jgi:hypothetical protein
MYESLEQKIQLKSSKAVSQVKVPIAVCVPSDTAELECWLTRGRQISALVWPDLVNNDSSGKHV